MSEEIRKQNSELHDAALSGVSGGVGGNYAICQSCNANQEPSLCTAEGNDMADYIQWNKAPKDWYSCPFHRKNRGKPGSEG